MGAYKKGHACIWNAEGTIKLNGLATLTNDVSQATWRDVTDVFFQNDAGGVPRTVLKNFDVLECSFTFKPGVGSGLTDRAATIAAVTGLRKMMGVVVASFDMPELNCDASSKTVIAEISGTQGESATGSFDVTLRKYIDTAGNAIDFTGAWAAV